MSRTWHLNNNLPNPRWLVPIAIIFVFLLCLIAQAEEAWTDEQIVQAVYLAEGGMKARYYYGIRSVKYRDIAEARKICFNSVRNNRKRYADYGYRQYPDFLSFLASRYCPVTGKLSPAEKRLNKFWIKNIRYFLARNNGRKGEK